MICPKCFKEQSAETTSCERCGIIFAKWNQPVEIQKKVPHPSIIMNKPAAAPPAAVTPAPTPIPGKLVFILKLISLAAVIYGWYWFMYPVPGSPVSQNAYIDRTSNFAIVVPDDWKWVKANKCSGKYNACVVFEAYKDLGEQQLRPFVNIVVIDQKSFRPAFSNAAVSFTEKNKNEYAQDAVKGIATAFDSYDMQESTILRIDGVPSLAVEGNGMAAGYRLSGSFIIIPSSSHVFFLSFAGPEFYHSAFQEMVSSFRLTANRPSNFHFNGGLFGSIKGDLILGALFALTLAMIRFFAWSPSKSD